MTNGADQHVTFTRVNAMRYATAALVQPSMTASTVSQTPAKMLLANANATTSGVAHDVWITLDLVPKPEITDVMNAATVALVLVQTTALSALTTLVSTNGDTVYAMNTGAEKAVKTMTIATFTLTPTITTPITDTLMKETTGHNTMMDLNTITITTKITTHHLKVYTIPMTTITDTLITITTLTTILIILTTMMDTWDMDTTMVDSWANAIQHVMETVMDHGPLIVVLVEIMLTGTQTTITVDVTMDGTDMTVPTAMPP